MSVEEMVRRLVARGLVPREHCLLLWQHADNTGFGAAIETAYPAFQADCHGETLEAALEGLLVALNRAADLKPKPPC